MLGYLRDTGLAEMLQGIVVREARGRFLEQNVWSFKYQKREL